MTRKKRDGAAIVGVGAAACAACCAGPIVGFLAAIGIGTAASFALLGFVGLGFALAVSVALVRRHRAATACATGPEAVTVAAPTRRSATDVEASAASRS